MGGYLKTALVEEGVGYLTRCWLNLIQYGVRSTLELGRGSDGWTVPFVDVHSQDRALVIQSPVLYLDWQGITSTLQLVQQSLLKPLPHAFRYIQLVLVLLHAVWLPRVHDEAGIYALIF